jgi:hypothetical protein
MEVVIFEFSELNTGLEMKRSHFICLFIKVLSFLF